MTDLSACGIYAAAILAAEEEKNGQKKLAEKDANQSLWTINAPNFSMPPNWFGNAKQVSPLSSSPDQSLNTHTDLAALKDVYNPVLGEKLANKARQSANSLNSTGWCARGVVNAMQQGGFAGKDVRSASAFQIDAKLAKGSNFREVQVAKENLNNLPAGCVIVWQPSSGHENGHVAVTLGNAQEASDHVQRLIVRNAKYSVFVPVGVNFNC